MKNLLSEYDVNEKLLTNKERQEIVSKCETLKELLENKIRFKQNELLQREEVVLERIARQVGFDGYETGMFNYQTQYLKMIRGEKLDEKTNQMMKYFSISKLNDDEYSELVQEQQKLKKYETEQIQWQKQLYLNEVLTATRHRVEKYQPLMSAKTYNALSPEEKEKLRTAVTQTVRLQDGSKIQLDNNIAGKICTLWTAGITTGASCSGMVIDHPNHRHEENDRFGRWKAGENSFLKTETCTAYISLPVEGNHRELLQQVEEKMEKWGWTVEKGNVYGKDSLILRPQHTLDGLSYAQVCKEVDDMKEDIFHQCGMKDMQEARMEAMKIVEYEHGGKIHYTDRMLELMWKKLTENLRNIKDAIDQKTRRENIEEGKAVKLFMCEPTRTKLTTEQLEGVFMRSGIQLDRDSIIRQTEGNLPVFIVKNGVARMMKENEPLPDMTMIESSHGLSYLMAGQVKGTIHGGENEKGEFSVTVMIHPDAQTLEQTDKFTVTTPVSEWMYHKYMYNENVDMNVFLADVFKEHLYKAALDAYENSFQKKVDAAKAKQAVSDIRIRQGLDGNTYISCHVYGERQLAKKMTQADVEYYRKRMTASDKAFNGVGPELADKYFKNEIERAELDRGQQQGIKR